MNDVRTSLRVATLLVPLLAILAAGPARAVPRVTCHCTYGGETVDVAVAPTDDPYRVPAVPVGRRFLFRAVWVQAPAPEAALTISVHRATKAGPAPLAQVTYRPPWPVADPGAPHGFTGLHRVYEPSLGAELAFWCEGAPAQPAQSPGGLAPRPESRPTDPTVTIAFAGDVMLDDGPGRTLARGQDPLAALADVFRGADLAVANLECPVATVGAPQDKPWAFRAHPRAIGVLARHFGAVSLANNHSGDYGPEALGDTMRRLDAAGLPFFGAGRNLAEAHAPRIIERNGLRIALLGYDEFFPRWFEAGPASPGVAWADDGQILRDVRLARDAGADLVIPVLHWGWEGERTPCPRQRDLAHALIDAGADAVIGGHPHATQPAEIYRGRLVLYSLGNLVFDGFGEGPGREGWVLRLTLSKAGLVRWDTVAVRIDARGTPRPDPDAESPCGQAGDALPRTCRAGR